MPVQILFSSSVQKIQNNVRTVDEEYIIRGDKGLKIKYFNVRGDDIEKIVITGKDNEYKMKKTLGTNVVESTLDNKGLSTELKSSKLKFAKEYLKDLLKGGKTKLLK